LRTKVRTKIEIPNFFNFFCGRVITKITSKPQKAFKIPEKKQNEQVLSEKNQI